MWTCGELKNSAKQRLKPSYWKAFAVCLLSSFALGGSSSASFSSGGVSLTDFYIQPEELGLDARIDQIEAIASEEKLTWENIGELFRQGMQLVKDLISRLFSGYSQEQIRLFFFIFFAILAVALVISFAVKLFVGYPLLIGKSRFFVVNSKYDAPFNEIGYGFRNGSYMHFVGIVFWRQFKIFLWSLLLWIPGIIKRYEYSMVPYVLAENPELTNEEAFRLSREFTRGEKWHLFVLDLSFIGWYFLGVLCLGIGVLFVVPYKEATVVEFYCRRREELLNNGTIAGSQLPGVERFAGR